ncbi:MAG: glycosyl hydrolase family protein [Ruminococcaceae bacterium]|nr:glycosyl hydrolase family protein [Oscillospiraceae bacterium]
MKKICSLLLSVALIVTMVFCPAAGIFASAETDNTTQENVVIENTFDEADWNPQPNSNLLKEEISDGSNGNALRFNMITSSSATTGNAIRHYKIFDPKKIDGGYIDYKPSSNTTYKLTFRYRTRSLTSNNIFISVRSVANGTVGDVLSRAVTIKKSLKLTTNSDYKWDTAIAYFTTPETALQALAISVEWNGAADSTGAFNVALDDVKLETAPANFVLVNTFEEDDVNVDTINLGTDTTVYKNDSIDLTQSLYNNTSVVNASTLRTNSALGFRATRVSSNTKKVHFEIYDYAKGKDDNGKLQSFVPEVGSNYKITFDYKVARSTSTNISYTVRPVTVAEDGTRTLGDAIATAVSVPKNDTYHPTPAIWQSASVNVSVTTACDGLAITAESGSNVGTYTFFDNVVVHKYDENVIINDYEETILGRGKNADTMASTKITGANLFHLGTKSGATPNTTRILQFERITGQTAIAEGNYTYAEIYNPYDVNFAGFTPKADTYYKLSFDYKVKRNSSGAINFNVRGKTDSGLGDIIATAATVASDDAAFADYAWGYASILINTAGKNYDTFAISIETEAANNAALYPYLDNIMLEELSAEGEVSFNIHHSTGETEKYTATNLTDLSTITLAKLGYFFKGLYLDAEYTVPAVGIAYGVTDVYALWEDVRITENTYEEAGITKDRLQANNVFHFGTKTNATPNTSTIVQFYPIAGQNYIAENNYTYIEIYDPRAHDFATAEKIPSFKPITDSHYKITFDYKVVKTQYGDIFFNIRGREGEALGDVIATAATIARNNSSFDEYTWGKAAAYINTEGKNYDALAISIEATTNDITKGYPYIDNIKVEKVEDTEGTTRFAVHHNSAIYDKSRDILTLNNLALFSEITFADTQTAQFEGLYFDSDYTSPATGIVYGVTDVYAKWKDISKFVNSYDMYGITSKDQLTGEGITFWGKRENELAPNQTNVIQFNNVYGQNNINKDSIVHVEIYNPNDRNFVAGEKLSSFKPLINSVYKIDFDFRVKASTNSNISFNIRGKKDGKFSDILGTAVVLESGDPNYSSYVWDNAQVYVYTQGVEYDALALTIESDGNSNANLWPYIDNINVELVDDYSSGVINSIAPATNNKNGIMAIKNGKWFEIAENDYAKVKFNLNTATAIEGSRVVANIIGDNGKASEVTLFDFSNESGERTYTTTFKAPITGKVVISIFKNDDITVNQEVVVSDIIIDEHTPSILKGDANLDGKINVKDLVALKKSIAYNYAVGGDYLINADLNKDGTIGADDTIVNRKQILGIIEETSELLIDANYTFANDVAGSAEGTITLTSSETTDNLVEIYWGANDKSLDTYYFIGSAVIKAGQSVDFAMASHLAIPEGATQIIINDGIATKSFDFDKRYSASFVPDKIGLVKDYTVNQNVANVKVVYPSSLISSVYVKGISETYDMICEFRNALSDVLGADVELVSDAYSLDGNQNYIVVGNTKFAESTTILDSIKNARTDYYGDFAIKATGRQIYINADNNYALQFAFDYFLNTYCANGVTDIANDINYLSSNTLKTITLADVDINEYRIVYPETATVLEVDAAEYLAANIVKATGKAPMTIVNDSSASEGYEILIGHTNRTDGADYAATAEATVDNSYTITVEENRTIITGGTNSAINAGVIDFTGKLLTGSCAVGTYEGVYDGSFSLTNGFKLTWSDEFNSTALSATWKLLELNYETAAGGKVVWDNSAAVVENGALKATVSKIGGTNDCTGISLDTASNKLIKYGYFEARIKSFDEAGYMNGFWGSTIGEKANFIDGKAGTYYGEFDILEMYSTPNEIRPNLHNHCVGEATSKNYLQGEDSITLIKPYTTVKDMGSKFHNFAMEWTDDYIYFYLDGVKYYSFDCTALSEYEVFDMVTRIRLTFSAGKYVTPTADSDEAFVDWVRVWQKDEAGYVVK